MADLTQNAALVVAGPTNQQDNGIAGEAANAGSTLYLKTSDQRWYKGAATNGALSGNAGARIALSTALGAGQPITLLRNGQVNLGATLVVGQTYVYSPNSGAICPLADLNSGNYPTIIGVATNATFLTTPPSGIYASGVAKA